MSAGRGANSGPGAGIDRGQDLVVWTDYFCGVGGRPEGTYADAGAVCAGTDGEPFTLWVLLYGTGGGGVDDPEPPDSLVLRAADALAHRLSDLGFTGRLYHLEGRAGRELTWGRLGRAEARHLEDEALRDMVRCLEALGLPDEAYRTDYVRAHLDPAHHAKIAADWDELLAREARHSGDPQDPL